MLDFAGQGQPLSQTGFDAARDTMDIDDPALWAVLFVETSGCGFLPDRRPKILFERHKFRAWTGGRFDLRAPDVSGTSGRPYGADGAHQYARLEVAMKLDEAAALKSASWGLGQILGENHKDAGFADVHAMVAAMVAGEDDQLTAMVNFIRANGLFLALRTRDWTEFARHYNGPRFKENNYDGKLRDSFVKFSTGPMPDLRVRAVQAYLTYKGFDPHGVDGIAGTHTANAVKAFQASIGVAATGIVNDALLRALAESGDLIS